MPLPLTHSWNGTENGFLIGAPSEIESGFFLIGAPSEIESGYASIATSKQSHFSIDFFFISSPAVVRGASN
jgi:hypothetical protein